MDHLSWSDQGGSRGEKGGSPAPSVSKSSPRGPWTTEGSSSTESLKRGVVEDTEKIVVS